MQHHGLSPGAREAHAERTRAGMAAAKLRGATLGRPRVSVNLEIVDELLGAGASVRKAAESLGVGLATLQRALAARAAPTAAGPAAETARTTRERCAHAVSTPLRTPVEFDRAESRPAAQPPGPAELSEAEAASRRNPTIAGQPGYPESFAPEELGRGVALLRTLLRGAKTQRNVAALMHQFCEQHIAERPVRLFRATVRLMDRTGDVEVLWPGNRLAIRRPIQPARQEENPGLAARPERERLAAVADRCPEPPPGVPPVWQAFGEKHKYMCSWCGTTEVRLPDGTRTEVKPRGGPCPRCPIPTRPTKSAKGKRAPARETAWPGSGSISAPAHPPAVMVQVGARALGWVEPRGVDAVIARLRALMPTVPRWTLQRLFAHEDIVDAGEECIRLALRTMAEAGEVRGDNDGRLVSDWSPPPPWTKALLVQARRFFRVEFGPDTVGLQCRKCDAIISGFRSTDAHLPLLVETHPLVCSSSPTSFAVAVAECLRPSPSSGSAEPGPAPCSSVSSKSAARSTVARPPSALHRGLKFANAVVIGFALRRAELEVPLTSELASREPQRNVAWVERAAGKLLAFYASGGEPLEPCERCSIASPKGLPTCPYCGWGGGDFPFEAWEAEDEARHRGEVEQSVRGRAAPAIAARLQADHRGRLGVSATAAPESTSSTGARKLVPLGWRMRHPADAVVMGFALERAGLKVLTRLDPPKSPLALAVFGLAAPEISSSDDESRLPWVERACRSLCNYYRSLGALSACPRCIGPRPEGLPTCPYCGEGGGGSPFERWLQPSSRMAPRPVAAAPTPLPRRSKHEHCVPCEGEAMRGGGRCVCPCGGCRGARRRERRACV